jgi:hypothetical protein
MINCVDNVARAWMRDDNGRRLSIRFDIVTVNAMITQTVTNSIITSSFSIRLISTFGLVVFAFSAHW